MIWAVVIILVVFLILALSIATYSGAQLKETFEKYNAELCYAKITGGQFALMVADKITKNNYFAKNHFFPSESISPETFIFLNRFCTFLWR